MSHTRGAGPGTRWLQSARSGGGRGRIGKRGSWQFAMERTPAGWQTYASPPDSDQWSQGSMMQTLQQLLGYFDGLNGQQPRGGQGQGQSPYYAGPGAGAPGDQPGAPVSPTSGQPAYPPGYTTVPLSTTPPSSTTTPSGTAGPTMAQALRAAAGGSGGNTTVASSSPAGGLLDEPGWDE